MTLPYAFYLRVSQHLICTITVCPTVRSYLYLPIKSPLDITLKDSSNCTLSPFYLNAIKSEVIFYLAYNTCNFFEDATVIQECLLNLFYQKTPRLYIISCDF